MPRLSAELKNRTDVLSKLRAELDPSDLQGAPIAVQCLERLREGNGANERVSQTLRGKACCWDEVEDALADEARVCVEEGGYRGVVQGYMLRR